MNYQNFSIRVPYTIFGNGSVAEVGKVAKELGAEKVLLVTGRTIGKSDLLDRVKQPLESEGIGISIFSGVEPDNPMENVIDSAKAAKENRCDMIIGVGGGSTMDNAKVASVLADFDDIDKVDTRQWLGNNNVPRRGLPQIMVPTTSGTGSEWTQVIVVHVDGHKMVMRSAHLLPDAAIVDPLMALDMPQKVTVDTGMDALTHAIESYTGIRANAFSDMIEETAIRLIAANLRVAYSKGYENIKARYNMSFASMIACNTLLTTGAHLGHGFAMALQSAVHDPAFTHGAACSLALCPVMEFNMIANLEKHAKIAELMGDNVEGLSVYKQALLAIEAVRQLTIDLGMPQRLRDIGMKKEDIKNVVDILFKSYSVQINNNPRQCNREDALKILESVW